MEIFLYFYYGSVRRGNLEGLKSSGESDLGKREGGEREGGEKERGRRSIAWTAHYFEAAVK